MIRAVVLVAGWLLVSGVVGAAPLVEKLANLADQRQLALTVYDDDSALVTDWRRVNLAAGSNRLVWTDVAAKIRPETVILSNLDAADGLRLLAQDFNFETLTPQTLLEKNVGKVIMVIRTNPVTGVETREPATVLAAENGVVLQFGDHIETAVPGRLAFTALPDNLSNRPTLVLTVANSEPGQSNLQLSYLTAGLSWHADYNAVLSAAEDKMALQAWITLSNQSGVDYQHAKLSFVAGDVHNSSQQNSIPAMQRPMLQLAAMAPLAQENLFEYHLYRLPDAETLLNQHVLQVALLSAAWVPVKKSLELQGTGNYYQASDSDLGAKLRVAVFIEFENKGPGLGVPLPKGTMRFYQHDSSGNLQFIGADNIADTAKNQLLRMQLGDAFDIYANKKQTDFHKISTANNRYEYESAYQILLHNEHDKAVMVKVSEPIPGDWQIIDESLAHRKISSGVAVWQVPVPAQGEAVLTYRVRVQ